MTQDEALSMIKEAVNIASSGAGDKITIETHLSEEDILDSLDLMTFLFELEGLYGKSIPGIDERFEDPARL